MPRNWEIKEVDDHGAGITDDIRNAPPTFQEVCHNLIYDHQTHNLSNRFGSEILRDSAGDVITPVVTELSGKAIEQIFQLENQLIVHSWDEVADVGSLFAYDEQTELTTTVGTVQTCKGYDSYNQLPALASRYVKITDGEGGGIEGTLDSTGNGGNPNHLDHIVFEIRLKEGVFGFVNVTNYKDDLNTCYVDIQTPVIYPDGALWVLQRWLFVRDALNAAGHNFAFLPGTDTNTRVYPTGDLALSQFISKTKWSDELVSREPFTNRGHLQCPVYQGEAFIATEPYDRSFAINPADPDMLDPENFKPITKRTSVKRLSSYWDGSIATLNIRDSQLPTTYLAQKVGIPLLESNTLVGDPESVENLTSDYKYIRTVLGLNLKGGLPTTFGRFSIWFDRGPGQRNGHSASDVVTRSLVWSRGAFAALAVGQTVLVDYPDLLNGKYGLSTLDIPSLTNGEMALLTNLNFSNPDTFEFLGSEIIDAIGIALDEYSSRKDAFYNIGFTVVPEDDFDIGATYTLLNLSQVTSYHTALPDNVGNFFYNYGFYLKEKYRKLDDLIPKEVENLGPAALLSVTSISDYKTDLNEVPYWAAGLTQGVDTPTSIDYIDLFPVLVGSISKRFTETSESWFDFNDICGVYARTENTGTVYYDVFETSLFKPVVMKDDANFDPDLWGGADYGYFTELSDHLYDRDIIFGEQAYFNGGVSVYTGFPQGSYFLEIINGTAFYANIINNASRVYQSAPGIPSSAPRLLFSDFEDPLTGISSFLEKPMVFTENKTWRIEGIKDGTGVGRVFLRVVSDEFGCISNQSIVKTNIGLFYWSKVGIIFTDGLRAKRVTEHLLERFQTWRAAIWPNGIQIGVEPLRGSYNEVTKRLFWSALDPVTSIPIWIVCDLYYGVSNSMPFYTASGPNLEDELYNSRKDLFQTRVLWFSEDSSRVYRGEIGYDGAGDVAGSVLLTHKRGLTADECYETLTDTGFKVPIDPLMRSIGFSFGTKAFRKWVSKVTINLIDKNQSGVSIQPLGWDDLNSEYPHELGRCINYQHFIDPLPTVQFDPGGGAPLITRYEQGFPPTLIQFFNNLDATLVGGYIVSYKRRFPKGKIRTTYKQFGFRQLVHEVATIDTSALGISSVTITRLANAANQPVRIDLQFSAADNAFFATYCRENGAHYVQFVDSTEWRRITKIYTNTQTEASFLVFDGVNEIPVELIELGGSFKMGRAPVDQQIQLSDYSLTFSVIGDRTIGLPKPVELGGHT